MDPNANLSDQLRVAREILATVGVNPPWATAEFNYDSDQWGDEQSRSEYFEARSDELGGLGSQLAELVVALDEWRRKGGFDPYAPTLREHVDAVVAYNWSDEYDDAMENGLEGHIMRHLLALAEFLHPGARNVIEARAALEANSDTED